MRVTINLVELHPSANAVVAFTGGRRRSAIRPTQEMNPKITPILHAAASIGLGLNADSACVNRLKSELKCR